MLEFENQIAEIEQRFTSYAATFGARVGFGKITKCWATF
jgi:hypothetical protein